MADIDTFAYELFEEAKRFLEKARETDSTNARCAFLHAALLIGISSLEAQINAISIEMSLRSGLSILDKSILGEKDYQFNNGKFTLHNKLRMYNLMDRIEYLFTKFSQVNFRLDKTSTYWGKLHQGIDARNSLVHPKENYQITIENVESAFDGILGVLDDLYCSLYSQHYPAKGRRFDSNLDF
jgi:hypothetical protein